MTHAAQDAPLFRTGDLARLSGLGKATIEHYLRLGIVAPASVGRQGYRLFDEGALARIGAVRAGRRAGFTLGELGAALRVVEPAELTALLTALPPARCRAELVARGVSLAS